MFIYHQKISLGQKHRYLPLMDFELQRTEVLIGLKTATSLMFAYLGFLAFSRSWCCKSSRGREQQHCLSPSQVRLQSLSDCGFTKKGQDINYSAHNCEAGHTESVSGFNLLEWSRFEKIWISSLGECRGELHRSNNLTNTRIALKI